LEEQKEAEDSDETKGKAKKAKCPDFGGEFGQAHLKAHILSEPYDIEDLVQISTRVKACPYYASRASIKTAEVPYDALPLLLTSPIIPPDHPLSSPHLSDHPLPTNRLTFPITFVDS